jgi:hypothetical protein
MAIQWRSGESVHDPPVLYLFHICSCQRSGWKYPDRSVLYDDLASLASFFFQFQLLCIPSDCGNQTRPARILGRGVGVGVGQGDRVQISAKPRCAVPARSCKANQRQCTSRPHFSKPPSQPFCNFPPTTPACDQKSTEHLSPKLRFQLPPSSFPHFFRLHHPPFAGLAPAMVHRLF